MEILAPTLGSVLIQLPVFIVWFVGGVLALLYWRKHPRVSLLALLALGLFFVMALINAALSVWLPVTLMGRGIGATHMGLIYTVRGIVNSLLSAVGWGLLMAAIFGGRNERSRNGQDTL